MPKSRTCFSSAVCCSEAFDKLPQSARLLYYQLNFECSIIGEIMGARRVARGYGFDDGDIAALIGGGFVIETEGRYFIRHHFEHNRLRNDNHRAAARNQLDNAPHSLEFEGEEYKSAYRLMGR